MSQGVDDPLLMENASGTPATIDTSKESLAEKSEPLGNAHRQSIRKASVPMPERQSEVTVIQFDIKDVNGLPIRQSTHIYPDSNPVISSAPIGFEAPREMAEPEEAEDDEEKVPEMYESMEGRMQALMFTADQLMNALPEANSQDGLSEEEFVSREPEFDEEEGEEYEENVVDSLEFSISTTPKQNDVSPLDDVPGPVVPENIKKSRKKKSVPSAIKVRKSATALPQEGRSSVQSRRSSVQSEQDSARASVQSRRSSVKSLTHPPSEPVSPRRISIRQNSQPQSPTTPQSRQSSHDSQGNETPRSVFRQSSLLHRLDSRQSLPSHNESLPAHKENVISMPSLPKIPGSRLPRLIPGHVFLKKLVVPQTPQVQKEDVVVVTQLEEPPNAWSNDEQTQSLAVNLETGQTTSEEPEFIKEVDFVDPDIEFPCKIPKILNRENKIQTTLVQLVDSVGLAELYSTIVKPLLDRAEAKRRAIEEARMAIEKALMEEEESRIRDHEERERNRIKVVSKTPNLVLTKDGLLFKDRPYSTMRGKSNHKFTDPAIKDLLWYREDKTPVGPYLPRLEGKSISQMLQRKFHSDQSSERPMDSHFSPYSQPLPFSRLNRIENKELDKRYKLIREYKSRRESELQAVYLGPTAVNPRHFLNHTTDLLKEPAVESQILAPTFNMTHPSHETFSVLGHVHWREQAQHNTHHSYMARFGSKIATAPEMTSRALVEPTPTRLKTSSNVLLPHLQFEDDDYRFDIKTPPYHVRPNISSDEARLLISRSDFRERPPAHHKLVRVLPRQAHQLMRYRAEHPKPTQKDDDVDHGRVRIPTSQFHSEPAIEDRRFAVSRNDSRTTERIFLDRAPSIDSQLHSLPVL